MGRHPLITAVTVLANPDCPHCVHAVDVVTEWALEDGLAVSGLDLRLHPEAAAWMDAECSPVLVFQGRRERVHPGMPTHEEFHRLAQGG